MSNTQLVILVSISISCCLLQRVPAETRQDNTANKNQSSPRVAVVLGNLLPKEGGNKSVSKTAASQLNSPFGIDFDKQGTMYIVELGGGRIHTLSSQGQFATIGGALNVKDYQGDGGPILAARFNGMHNVAVAPNGMVYIADSWNHCIRRFDPISNRISTIAGTGKPGFGGDGGPATSARFNFVMCITLTPKADILHIADLKNHRIRALDLAKGIVTTVAGNGKKGTPADGAIATDSPLLDPRAVAADAAGNLYILERSGHSLRVVRPDGKISTVVGDGKPGINDGPAKQARLKSPKHITIDDQQRVVVADESNALIRRYDPRSKTVSTLLGGGIGQPPVKLSQPHGVCIHSGKLYVVDTGHDRILRIDSE